MTPYSVRARPSVQKDLRRLPEDIRDRIRTLIQELAHNPYPAGVVKLRGRQHTYRIRAGDYRVVYEVDDTIRHVLVQHVRHRSDVYR